MNEKLFARGSFLFAIGFFVFARFAAAATFNIPNGDVAALKSAIVAANSNGQADTINLASGGIYTLSAIDNGVNGLPVIGNDVAGLDLTINGNGARIQRSSATGTPAFRILAIATDASVNCTGLTIANGKLNGSAALTSYGGGIFNDLGSLSATNCSVIANSAFKGAGIYSSGGTVVLTNVDVNENVTPATGEGGGIWNEGQLTLIDSRVNLNTAGKGGGIHNGGNTTLQRTTLNDNAAVTGGGIYNFNTLKVESSTLHGNRAIDLGGPTGDGGGIWNSSVANLENSTLSNNTATYGAGIRNSVGLLLLTNCTFSRNSAATAGGAVQNIGGPMDIRCSTFAFNVAPGGLHAGAGAIHNSSTSNDPAIVLYNNIFQQGATGPNIVNAGAVVTSKGYNLASDDAGGYLNKFSDIKNANANLGPLQNNGGPTLTHAPVVPSPAIDAGDDNVLESPLNLTTDQRGSGFPRRRGTHVDIGAIETGVALVVTTFDDHDDGNCTMADCTLREAINASNAAGSSDVSFVSGLNGTIQLSSALPEVSGNLSLHGPGASLLNVRRNSGGDYRIFTIRNGTSSGPSAVLSGLTISNGQAPSLTAPYDSGGGLLNDRGTLYLDSCVVTGNQSALTDSSLGGGIFNYEGTLGLQRCTVVGNNARYGGGIASQLSAGLRRYLDVRGSTISDNSAQGGNGGGFFSQATNSASFAEVVLSNCTFSGNSATTAGFVGGAGGAIFNNASTGGQARLSLEDCTVSNNTAVNTAGIYNLNFSATARVGLRNTILKSGAGGNLLNSSGQIESLGHNLCDDFAGDASNPGTGPSGYLNGPGDVRNTDPQLGPLQDNGGPTLTHALLPGSPAINSGQNGGYDHADQRGFMRRGVNDIGAFEFDAFELRIVEILRQGNDMTISFQAAKGLSYELVRRTSISDGVWQEFAPAIGVSPTSDGIAQLIDPGAAALGRAFYRVQLSIP